MPFVMPIALMRKKLIIKRLRACGATSEESAKTLAEAGVINPNGFKRITDRLVETESVHRASGGRYYV